MCLNAIKVWIVFCCCDYATIYKGVTYIINWVNRECGDCGIKTLVCGDDDNDDDDVE